MSTRVQKGGTVFRPVARVRPRAAETPRSVSESQDLTSQLLPEAHQTPLPLPIEDISPVVTSTQSTLIPKFSLQNHAPPAIANTTRTNVPIVVSSSRAAPIAQSAEPVPPSENTMSSAGSSHADVPIVEQTSSHQSEKRSRSAPLAACKRPKKLCQGMTPVFTASADPGEDLDPTSVTMASLCEDTGQGRMSSKAAQILDNHLSWKKSNREKRVRMKVRMEARKYGRSEDNGTMQTGLAVTESQRTSSAADAMPGLPSIQPASGSLQVVEDTSGQGFDYSQDVSTSRYNVQVRIGPNGETIVDEESLFVDRNAEEDATEYTHVEESDVTKFVNSATYSKRFRGSRWSAEETELFYDALSQFGENYELISYVLPGRDRKACKNKFKTEDRKNPQRINYCLDNRKPYDMQNLSRMTGKDFSGPTPEIRAPVALSLASTHNVQETIHPPVPGQATVSSSTTAEQAEEVVGDISSFDPE